MPTRGRGNRAGSNAIKDKIEAGDKGQVMGKVFMKDVAEEQGNPDGKHPFLALQDSRF